MAPQAKKCSNVVQPHKPRYAQWNVSYLMFVFVGLTGKTKTHIYIVENLNMCRLAAKFIPRLLTNDQKQRCIHMCLELREKAKEGPTFISGIIMGDESWI
jgi:hypothetical protein